MTLTIQMAEPIEAAHDEKLTFVARQMSKWMDQVLGTHYHKYRQSEFWNPAINLYEDQDEFWVVVDLAGVAVDQIDLRVTPESGGKTSPYTQATLVLSGYRSAPVPKRTKTTGRMELRLMEIDHGRYVREIPLPCDPAVGCRVDIDAISAEYRSGYLWIRLPKLG